METKFLWAFLDFVLFICNIICGNENIKDKEYGMAAFCYFAAGVCFSGAFNCLLDGIAIMAGVK